MAKVRIFSSMNIKWMKRLHMVLTQFCSWSGHSEGEKGGEGEMVAYLPCFFQRLPFQDRPFRKNMLFGFFRLLELLQVLVILFEVPLRSQAQLTQVSVLSKSRLRSLVQYCSTSKMAFHWAYVEFDYFLVWLLIGFHSWFDWVLWRSTSIIVL